MKPEEKEKALDLVLLNIEKEYGKGTVCIGEYSLPDIEFISTGCISLDKAMGGGFAKGRIAEIYGPESCIEGNTFIQYELRTKEGIRQNHKGGSIKRLWERFHGQPTDGDGRGKYLRPQTIGAEFYCASINEENRVFQNKIVDVVKTGMKECFELTTISGLKIVATADHKFYMGNIYKRLGDLEPGEKILIHNNTVFTKEKELGEKTYRNYLYVKNHPVAGLKITKEKNGKEYPYYRLAKARAIIEAQLNNLTLDQYTNKLNDDNLDGLKFLDRNDHVHHLDEDCTNDDITNLILISAKEHGRLHALERHNNLRYTAIEDVIESIVPVGEQETFDIKMESPFNNYIADGFITHNSGKTTITLHAIAQAQAEGETCAFIDAEHALDLTYAKALGVDTDKLLITQPDCAEDCLNITDKLISSGALGLVVVDSVAALVPRAELEGEVGDAHMGLQARLMGQAMRKLTGKTKETNTSLIFINQLRMKIGVMFGNPETTAGGNALKFYASQRLDIRVTGKEKEGDDITGNACRIKVVKNKIAPPFKEATFTLEYGRGINKYVDLLRVAVEKGLVEKSGAWYSYKGERVGQGEPNSVAYLQGHPAIFAELYNLCK